MTLNDAMSNTSGFPPQQSKGRVQTRLYHVDTLGGTIHAATITSDGNLIDSRLFATIPNAQGFPDGPSIDAEGCLWIGLYNGHAARRYSSRRWPVISRVLMLRAHQNNLVIEAREPSLILRNQLRIETPGTVAWHVDLDLASIGNDALAAVAALRIGTKVIIHLGVERPFGQHFLQRIKQTALISAVAALVPAKS